MNTKVVESGIWVVEETTRLDALTIAEGAEVKAPEGYYLTMTVSSVGTPIEPGTYEGDIVLTVAKEFIRHSLRFGEETVSSFHAGAIISDGKIVNESSVPSVFNGGSVTDTQADDITVESNEWDFNGFYITDDTEYTINNMKMHLVGDGTDDFVGMGAGIAVAGNAKVTINNADVLTEGIGRGTLFVGEHGEATLNDCKFETISHVPTPEELEAGRKLERMMEPPWAIGLRGYGRTLNVAGHGKLNLNRCKMISNSWGVLSVDGAIVNRMNVKDSEVTITGDNGYGCFSICDDFMFDYKAFGDYGCYDTIDHSVFKVPYTGILMSLGNSGGEFKNGSVVESGRFGAFVHRNSGGILKVNSKSEMRTKASTVVVKGSNTTFEFDDAILKPENGTIIQLQDNDDVGMCMDPFQIPVGEVDVRDDRDLTTAIETEDVFVSFANMETAGNLLNSTTNMMACNRRLPKPADAPPAPVPEIPMGEDGKPKLRGFVGEDLMGAKNMQVTLSNATLSGIISSAKGTYKEGLTLITPENREELSHVTQTPAEPINNGVIVIIDENSTWNVTGTSYLTALTIAEGGRVAAEGGKLTMTVDGKETKIEAGTYTGMIKLEVQ